MPKDSTYFAFR